MKRRLMLALVGLMAVIVISNLRVFPAQSDLPNPMPAPPGDSRIVEIEQTWQTQYFNYFDLPATEAPLTVEAIRLTLSRINADSQTRFALIYVFPHPENLELVLVVPGQSALRLTLPEVPKARLDPVVQDFRQQLVHPVFSGRDLASAQQLYQWIVAPLEPQLQAWEVDTLIFCTGVGLRSTPLAALHDGQHYLTETYGVSLIPAFSLTDHRVKQLKSARVLAMGASEFEQSPALPAVPLELSTISQEHWPSQVFLNEQFTQANLQQQLDSGDFAIVHLATHAEFRPGDASDSYIQLWQDERLNLHELTTLNWRDRPVELLVLSACQTAQGDQQAELGFAGLSFQAGVKSTLASLWLVSDLGTLALMHEFYWQLARPEVTTKAAALQRTQIAMIQGQVRIEAGQLYNSGGEAIALPASLIEFSQADLSRPFFWGGFTLVGSPW